MKAKRHVLYTGFSAFIPTKRVVVLYNSKSKNRKVGDIPSVSFLPDIGKPPSRCVKDGDDNIVCGDCPLRGKACYVNTTFAPNRMYEGYQSSTYTSPSPKDLTEIQTHSICRVGQVGDCASLSTGEWMKVKATLPKQFLNYTHQWRVRLDLAKDAMASVHTPKEREEAKALGFRTFRTKVESTPVLEGEVVCPASVKEDIQCKDCQLCVASKQAKDIVIDIHGTKGKINWFTKWTQERVQDEQR